uniref:Uncharacterized protein n=1 Tax=Periophthalmus magnuspinnatus TaxID=409849 RepID=A0A3B4B3Q2_9GOBI
MENLQEEIHNIKRTFERELSVKKLLESGVAVNQRNSTDERTLLANAAIEGSENIVDFLLKQEGHVSTVRLLLDRRCPIDHRAYDGHSALSAALLEEQTEVAELLMRRGADTDVRDAEGRPLLYLLVLEGRLEMSTLLLEKGGVPLESKDAEGRTALHVACWQGSVEMVNLLLKYSANPNAQDSEGRPPLHSIAWTGHTQVGRKLLETPGIDIDLCCNQGATALSIAAQEGNVNIVAMLLDKGANPEHVDKYNPFLRLKQDVTWINETSVNESNITWLNLKYPIVFS